MMLRRRQVLPLVALVAAMDCSGTPSNVDSATSGGMPDLVVSGTGRDLAGGLDAAGPPCNGDDDGVISRQEEPFLVGAGGFYLVNGGGMNAPVMVRPQGGIWDYSGPTAADQQDFDPILTARGAW